MVHSDVFRLLCSEPRNCSICQNLEIAASDGANKTFFYPLMVGFDVGCHMFVSRGLPTGKSFYSSLFFIWV